MTRPTTSDCATCGRNFTQAARGRVAIYCSGPCRTEGHHRHREMVAFTKGFDAGMARALSEPRSR